MIFILAAGDWIKLSNADVWLLVLFLRIWSVSCVFFVCLFVFSFCLYIGTCVCAFRYVWCRFIIFVLFCCFRESNMTFWSINRSRKTDKYLYFISRLRMNQRGKRNVVWKIVILKGNKRKDRSSSGSSSLAFFVGVYLTSRSSFFSFFGFFF